MSAAPAVRAEGLVQVYGRAGEEVTALRGVDLEVESGSTVSILGPSGSGKSTLLWILAGLLRPTAGRVELLGRSVHEMGPADFDAMRLRNVGVVLQSPGRNLLPYETAAGNLLFAQKPARVKARIRRQRAAELLEAVGLSGAAGRPAGRLSGGEQQRLAVAVALANGPSLLLADEPTSQLDRASGAAVVDLMMCANRDFGATVVAVTHDLAVAARLSRTVTIRDGRVGAEGRGGSDYLVVGRDGTLSLPDDLLEVLPPGSLAEATREGDTIRLRRVDPG